VLCLVLSAYLAFQVSRARHIQLLGALVDHVDTTERIVALTFDDGPSPEYTPHILETLRAWDARATFFIVGERAEAAPAALRALIAAGHEIGNHTWTHPRLLALSQHTIAREIERTDQMIRAAGYAGAIYVRPPNGKRLLDAPYYLWRHERVTAMWNLEPDSVAGIANDPEAMVAYVRNNVSPGAIILMHVMGRERDASRRALPLIMQALNESGYRFATLTELVAARSR
jgi:peptidoglycan/xylan/chitin deacetylase (PgdA/CDA1 family)